MAPAQILVVEDENIVARDIERNLHVLGYEVPAIAASGEDAIDKAVAIHPDLVLMDIRLRGRIDGVSAAQEIGGRLAIPVVYLTSYADDETLHRAKLTEPFGYIVKPFEKKDLHATIEMALYRHQTQMTLRSLALADELTGLYNRRGFLTLADQHLKFARRATRGCSLLFIDVDRLKQINDTFGHREGDHALITTAKILRQTFRESDVIARLGGLEPRERAECVDPWRVGVRALDVAVPWHRRDAPGVLGAEVERERPAPAEPGDAEPVAAGPRLLLGVVGGGRDVAEVLLTRHFAGDGAHLLEVLPLHPALTVVELGRDRVVAGVREAPHHVLVVVAVAGEAGDHDDDRVAPLRLRVGVVRRDHRPAHVQLDVAGGDALRVGDDRLRQRDAGREDAAHRRVRAELQDFPAAERTGHERLLL